jgi:uncharacterized protein (TIGR03086 family)
MELLDALDQSFDQARKVVVGVRPDQLGAPTPCTEWTVQQLLTHMVGAMTNIGRGVTGAELLPDMNKIDLDADVAAQYAAASEGTLAAWRAHGLDGEVNIGAGPMPAALAASINLVDACAHTWDLARATGQDDALPDPLATYTLQVAEGFVDGVRQFAGINPAVPVDAGASPTAKFVAYMGRKP